MTARDGVRMKLRRDIDVKLAVLARFIKGDNEIRRRWMVWSLFTLL